MQFLNSGNTLLIFLKGKQFSLRKEDARYNKVMIALAADDEATVLQLMQRVRVSVNDIMTEIKKTFENLEVVISGDSIKVDGCEMKGFLVSRIKELQARELPFHHLVNFMKRAFLNPKKFVTEDLFQWLDDNDMPVTDDGCFLAYKRLNADFTDVHSSTFDNSIGEHLVFPMDRRVDLENRCQECTPNAFHVCAYDYLNGFSGARTVVVKVDPQHIFSFPQHGGKKIQVFEYDVLAEIDVDANKIPDKIVADAPKLSHDILLEAKSPSAVETLLDLRSRFSFTLFSKGGKDDILLLFKLKKGDLCPTPSEILLTASCQHPGIKYLSEHLGSKLAVSDLSNNLKSGKAFGSDKIIALVYEPESRAPYRLRVFKDGYNYDLFEVRM